MGLPVWQLAYGGKMGGIVDKNYFCGLILSLLIFFVPCFWYGNQIETKTIKLSATYRTGFFEGDTAQV